MPENITNPFAHVFVDETSESARFKRFVRYRFIEPFNVTQRVPRKEAAFIVPQKVSSPVRRNAGKNGHRYDALGRRLGSPYFFERIPVVRRGVQDPKQGAYEYRVPITTAASILENFLVKRVSIVPTDFHKTFLKKRGLTRSENDFRDGPGEKTKRRFRAKGFSAFT